MPQAKYNSPELTDEEILALHKNNDQEALKLIINRYTSPLYNFTARLTNKNDAPDIVQEVFIKTWKNIRNFDSRRASFKTWIFIIARNTITDFLRKKRNLLFSDMGKNNEEDTNSFVENIPSEEMLPDVAMQKLEDSAFLNKTLEKLRLDYQEVLILHYQEEMTFEEIGRVLNKSLNTIKSQHRRAIIGLRKILE